MRLLHRTARGEDRPDLSIVLTDWSCRESFHLLDYLSRQSWPRERYEVLWVEYYDAVPAGIERRMAEARRRGRPAPIDVHLLMEMDRRVVYHKHLMYNLGILLARGRIVCICDSDAIVTEGFVQAIVEAFRRDPKIVLHLDQVRNVSRRFYPFDYPSPERIVGPGCINWINGRPAGLWDDSDPLHRRNYGACMAAPRADLIAIGGADEHIDYLGHICGPYEMTFRLVNAGSRELWHQREWVYHVWHPGERGRGQPLGPHDGRHMSTTALEARSSGRVLPLVENPAIRRLRTAGPQAEAPLNLAIDAERVSGWHEAQLARVPIRPRRVGARSGRRQDLGPRLGPGTKLRLAGMLAGMLAEQLGIKLRMSFRVRKPRAGRGAGAGRSPWLRLGRLVRFLLRAGAYDAHLMRQCWRTLKVLRRRGERRICLYGTGRAARIIRLLSRRAAIDIVAVASCDGYCPPGQWPGPLASEADLARRGEPVVIATLVNIEEKVSSLRAAGVDGCRVWRLQ
ncbi:MAG: hypothetical protein B1H04_03540 [Planctomycetales bacterium 4484_123]|nr:MAG: hypothetical protein B1H04_03540 [Planctomycetales bacterium 4484_123]